MFFRKKCLDDPMVVRLDPFIAISKEDGEQRIFFFPENGLMVGHVFDATKLGYNTY